MDGKERVGCKNRKSTHDDRGIAFAEHRGLKVFEIRRPDPLFRFADAATGRMDAGAEAAGGYG